MKNGNLIVNIIFGAAIILLFVLYAKKPAGEAVKEPVATEVDTSLEAIFADEEMVEANFPIAYVIVDSVMQNYLYYQKLEKQYQNLVSSEEAKLQKKAEQFQKYENHRRRHRCIGFVVRPMSVRQTECLAESD